jgi:hypothetical protein
MSAAAFSVGGAVFYNFYRVKASSSPRASSSGVAASRNFSASADDPVELDSHSIGVVEDRVVGHRGDPP